MKIIFVITFPKLAFSTVSLVSFTDDIFSGFKDKLRNTNLTSTITSSNPNVVYALFSATDDSYHGIYKSIDGGDTWNLQSNSPNILGRSTDGTSTGGQSWYDLSLGVSSVDENHVYVGGINLWESNDGGQNWDINASSGNGSNYSYMHVDQHALEFNPLNNSVYAGNDGGIYKWRNDLKINKFGIPEPKIFKKIIPEVVLVPLLAFDKNKNISSL